MLKLFGLFLSVIVMECYAQDTVDCTKPPPFMNPHLCCKDPPPSEVAQLCSEKTKVPLRMDKGPSLDQQQDIGAVTCFAECVMTESKYLNDGKLDMDTIKVDLRKKFAKDPDYIPVMENAFGKCAIMAQRYLPTAPNASPLSGVTNACSPMPGIILGCVYKEFFENCPASKWNSNPQCNAVQSYVIKCSKV